MDTIEHDAARRRFHTRVDGHDAEVEYAVEADRMVITHTRVPPPIAGRGIAGELVRTAFEHARERSLAVEPRCAYAAQWVRRHPEFADLVR